jgi:general secretion pathway protein G
MKSQRGTKGRAGFSLLGVIMLLAVVAILAGTITPMVFRQMMEARERDTVAELVRLENGLVAYFEDVGRFPTEAEGLIALVNDPGATGWQGPYVLYEHDDPVVQIGSDAWNRPYFYDLYPNTTPVDTAAVLVVSGGRNRQPDAGTVGGTWNVTGAGDDLLGLVTAARVNRELTTATSREQELLARAAQAYFRDHMLYPTDLDQLRDDYLDAGVGSDALYDQWQRMYVLTADNAAVPPTLTITSLGPDQSVGGGDDVALQVDSVIPGRRASYYELAINQAAVDAGSGTGLTGDWTTDRSQFGLAAILEDDGWGNPYEEQMSTRTILSGGPDADYFTPDDNIPPGVVPDDVLPAGDGIEYVDGSGETLNNRCDRVRFQITNTSSSPITLTSMTLTWASPTAYYKKVKIIEDVVEQDKPQVGSGVTANFKENVTLQPGQTATVEIESFRGNSWQGGPRINMSNVDMTVTFSDGSTFTFNTGSC